MEKEKKEKTNELERKKGTKTSNKKKWLIPVIVCALILTSVGGYFLYLKVNHKGMFAGTIVPNVRCINSSLANECYNVVNKTSPRNHEIDTISIRLAGGLHSIYTLRDLYGNEKNKASCNYGIGNDGKIAQYVDEKDRSWCMGNVNNDNRAVTISVAAEKVSPYPVSDVVYNQLIKLIADVCKRNDIEKLVWSDSKEDRILHENGANLTVARDFANVADPGDYLYSRMGDIADKVNDIINPDNGQNYYTDKTSNKKK